MRWSLGQRIAFRFGFSYLLLFFFPFPGGLVNPPWLGGVFDRFWGWLVPVLASLLGVRLPDSDGGSADSTFCQLTVVAMLLVAALATIVWSIADRRRGEYRALFGWSRIWMRYVLAVCMLTYGASKVLMVQFEPPGYGRLIEPVGQLSPMALLWTFMGSSTLYTSFSGIIEVLGGLLLFARRTTTLGALIVAGAMTQVFVLNLGYDVPVKLGSLHILLLAVVLIGADARRLLDFFVRNRATEPADLGPALPWPRAALALKAVLATAFVGYLTWSTVHEYRAHLATREHEPVAPDGHYRVAAFRRDGAVANPADLPWRNVSLAGARVGIRTVDGTLRRFTAASDPTRGTAQLIPEGGGAPIGSIHIELQADGAGHVTGNVDGHAIDAELQRENPADMPLVHRGFHWVSEAPYFH